MHTVELLTFISVVVVVGIGFGVVLTKKITKSNQNVNISSVFSVKDKE